MQEIEIPKIEIIDLKTLKIDGENPNKMDAKQKEALWEGMKKYGVIVPIITNKEGTIADGQNRWEVLLDHGIVKGPVIKLPISDVDRRILRQVLNKLKGQHDLGLDAAEYKKILQENQFEELQRLMGKSDKQLVQFLANVEKANLGEDDLNIENALEEKKYNVKLGDTWHLGDHVLMCGDATNDKDVKTLIMAETINMVFTDPPYNVDYGASKHPTWNKKWNGGNGVIKNDCLNKEDWIKFVDAWMKNIIETCQGAIYICMSCKEWATIMDSFERNNGHWSSTIIWVKNTLVLSRKDYHTQFEPILFTDTTINETPETGEPILYGWPEKTKRTWTGGRKQTDIWRIDRRTKNDLHPTMKPVELVKKAISNNTNKGENVLDLFGGSGSTLIACEKLERKCFMMEIDPSFCSVIIERWEKVTGLKAKKLEDMTQKEDSNAKTE